MLLLMTSWITAHSFLSLNWDEWASIVAIGTAIVLVIRWLIKKVKDELFEPTNSSIKKLTDSFNNFSERQRRSEERLEEGDKKFIHHDEELRDHERRITNLEGRK